jgi:hypothetical protein
MSIVLTILALILAGVSFFYPLGDRLARPVEVGVLALLAVALVVQLANPARRRKETREKAPAPKPEVAPPLEAAVQAGCREGQVRQERYRVLHHGAWRCPRRHQLQPEAGLRELPDERQKD